MNIYPGDNLSKQDVTRIAKEAGEATEMALRAAMLPPDLSSTRVFELVFQAMLVATDAAPLHGEGGSTAQESVS